MVQVFCPFFIIQRLVSNEMISSIYFYDQTLFETHKIWYISINRMLTSELKT